jgi:hypothetical protein
MNIHLMTDWAKQQWHIVNARLQMSQRSFRADHARSAAKTHRHTPPSLDKAIKDLINYPYSLEDMKIPLHTRYLFWFLPDILL